MRNLIGVLCVAVICSPAIAADVKKETSDARKVQEAPKADPQQARTEKCNKEASAKGVKGDERKAFMSKCLQW